MSIRQIVENMVWDEVKQEWVKTAPKTYAAAVETADGATVQAKLDAIPGQIASAKTGAIEEIRADVAESGNTLAKLYSLIEGLQTLTQTDTETLDTLQEVVDFIKNNRVDIDAIGTNKVSIADIVNNLTTVATAEGKVLDARQGKILKDMLDELISDFESFETQAENFATQEQLTNGVNSAILAARPILNETPPINPANGQFWLKPAGTIEIAD